MTDQTPLLRLALADIYGGVIALLLLFLLLGMVLHAAGHSRFKHHWQSMGVPIRLFGLIALGSFLFGWWMRHVFVTGPGITGGFGDATDAWPWAMAMGPTSSSLTGERLDWVDFLVMSWMVAALVAGSLMERARAGAVMVLGLVAGVVCFPIGSAWLWSVDGWMVRLTGFHDAFGGASVHALAGGFALASAQVLGPRAATAGPEGQAQVLPAATPWLAVMGALLVVFGLAAAAAATLRPAAGGPSGFDTVGVYGTVAPLSGALASFLMAVAGGLLVGHVVANGEITGMAGGGIAGAVAAAAGGDLYHPLQACLIGAAIAWICLRWQRRLAVRHGIDDPVGTVSLHGLAGGLGVIAAGVLLWTFPATAAANAAVINPLGNLAGAAIAFGVLGYLPGLAMAQFLETLGVLRVPVPIELAGADLGLAVAAAAAHGAVLGRERAALRDGAAAGAWSGDATPDPALQRARG